MARRTDNDMERYFISFVINESFDPTLLRIMIFHLAIVAGAILVNASSPRTGQYMGIEENDLLSRSGDCNLLIHVSTLTPVLVEQHRQNTTVVSMASTLPAMKVRKSFTKLRTSLNCFFSFDI